MNLAHLGIGNNVAHILAEAMSTLPYMQVLNISDNNLEDSGLTSILKSVSKHKDIKLLDISQNKFGSNASAALAEYIGDRDCKLNVLRLSASEYNCYL